jgi:hypothetical protein
VETVKLETVETVKLETVETVKLETVRSAEHIEGEKIEIVVS